MTADLERPRRAKGEPMSAYSERREAYVAAHRRERNKRHIITERTERIVERIEPVEDEATKRRLQEAEDALAWLMEPGEPELESASYIDRDERPAAVEEVVGPLEADEDPELAAIPKEFRALMLEGEAPAKFTERMKRRWQALKHLQIDGSKPTNARALPDMTDEERDELEDLEARNKISRWLD